MRCFAEATVLTARFPLLSFATLALASCMSGTGAGRFSTALGARIEAHAATVDLAAIDGPAWDAIFVFEPGSSREDNCRRLQLGWLECKTTMPAIVRPNEEFLVFMVNGRISSAQRHPQSNGAFGPEVTQDGRHIERRAARFAVVEDSTGLNGGAPLPRLHPIL